MKSKGTNNLSIFRRNPETIFKDRKTCLSIEERCCVER